MAFSHGWLSLMSFFHLSDWQTNPAVLCSVWLWPANIRYVYLPSLVQGTYYSLKPLSVTGSQSLDKKALSVVSQQTPEHSNVQTLQPASLPRIRRDVAACSFSSSRLSSASSSVLKTIFAEKKAAFEYAYAMSKHVLLSRVPLHFCQHSKLKTGKTSQSVSVGLKSRLCGGHPCVKQSTA